MRLLLFDIVLLWLQLYLALVATWRFGEYYAYGWFVPFLAAGLVWRRWHLLVPPRTTASGPATLATVGPPPGPANPPLRVAHWVVALGMLAVIASIPLQVICSADPGWRPPLLLLAALTFGFTHLMIWHGFGPRISLGLLPVTVFALSAVPYPWQFEQNLIRSLTGTVVSLTREGFLLTGQPVEMLGERLSMGTEAVDVSDGCSGIRSLQSLIMGALFFGELLLLSLPKRLALVMVAGACAIGINTIRAYWLASIHFSHGKAAAAAAHDFLGHTAYWISTAVVFLFALWLVRTVPAGRRVIRRTQTALAVPTVPTPQ